MKGRDCQTEGMSRQGARREDDKLIRGGETGGLSKKSTAHIAGKVLLTRIGKALLHTEASLFLCESF